MKDKSQNGIRTFSDCPYRREDIRSRGFGEEVMVELCPDGNPLHPRCTDYSRCAHPHADDSYSGRGCRIGRGGGDISNLNWCEVFLCDRKCPMGYIR